MADPVDGTFRSRSAGTLALLVILAAQVSCATAPPPRETAGAALPPADALPPGEALPPGAGRAILQADCTSCHDLGGLWAYKGFYDEQRWRDLVETMIAHGAQLNAPEVDALVDYLVEHFGPGSR